jgi:hypothetical protein
MSGSELRLAVSGTYSSGKTTTSEALSIATGIPRTDALTAREITVNLFPGRRFHELSLVICSHSDFAGWRNGFNRRPPSRPGSSLTALCCTSGSMATPGCR